MKRTLLLATVAVTGLTAAGLAVAALGEPETAKVSPSFTLTASAPESSTCEGTDGTYATDELSASGRIAAGALAGAATLELTWVKNAKENLGYAEGTLVVVNADEEEKVRADVVGAVTGTTLRGTVVGDVGVEADSRLVGTISVVRTGNRLAVKIGNGTLAGIAVVSNGASCAVQEQATGEVVDIDLENLYLTVETEEGELVTIELTEEQAEAISDEGIDFGDIVTVTYVETEEGLTELVEIERG